ncbi:3'-5' exoribonuclease [Candidatus Kaiserbacteria bacterium]|nr:3'-5' exoribonuclease [Candidatus Kaiserbacteria bacterium]
MKPFSQDIIFFDTEFSSLDPCEGEILSIGMVKLSGEEFYIELEYDGEVSEWVKDNILHTLIAPKVSREEAQKQIKEFVGEGKPHIMAYVNQFDAIYTYKLFGIDNHPFHWLPIDFASMLFAHGKDPEMLVDLERACKEFGIDHTKYKQHHALDDAKVLRKIYLKLADQSSS